MYIQHSLSRTEFTAALRSVLSSKEMNDDSIYLILILLTGFLEMRKVEMEPYLGKTF